MKALHVRVFIVACVILILCAGCSAAAAEREQSLDGQEDLCVRGDVDGDGQIECLYNVSPAASSQGAWQVEVRDRTGRELKGIIAGARLLKLADLDSDEIPELLLERQQASQASATAPLPTPCPCAKPGADLIAQLAVGLTGSDGRLVTVFSFLTGDEKPFDTYGDGRVNPSGDD